MYQKMTRNRPERPTTYMTLMRAYNRDRRNNKEECECGKFIFPNQREKHLQTKYHNELVRRRKDFEAYLVKEAERQANRVEEIKATIIALNAELAQLSKADTI